jgi:hypothetical protein
MHLHALLLLLSSYLLLSLLSSLCRLFPCAAPSSSVRSHPTLAPSPSSSLSLSARVCACVCVGGSVCVHARVHVCAYMHAHARACFYQCGCTSEQQVLDRGGIHAHPLACVWFHALPKRRMTPLYDADGLHPASRCASASQPPASGPSPRAHAYACVCTRGLV